MHPDFIGPTNRQAANNWRYAYAERQETRDYYCRVADLIEAGVSVVDATFMAATPQSLSGVQQC